MREDGEHGTDALVWATGLAFCSNEARIRPSVLQHNATRIAKPNALRVEACRNRVRQATDEAS